MRLLEELNRDGAGTDLSTFARRLDVDERTIRRDVDFLQELLAGLRGIDVRRGKVFVNRESYAPGYFADHVGDRRETKIAIAQCVVKGLADNTAIAITAGSTTFYVARELRRAHVEMGSPRNVIALTNSLPALMELISGGVSTGVIGEVFEPDDCAFHSHELRSAFHPNVAIVGASGLIADASTGELKLFSHRAEEAAFMKQLLAPVPEIVIAADASKVGRRHPWVFTDRTILEGKRVRLVTDRLDTEQRDMLNRLASAAPKSGFAFEFVETSN